MDTIELLSKFADPEVMLTLTAGQRLTAGLITTMLGMGITFVALVVLQFVIMLMAKLGSESKKPSPVAEKSEAAIDTAPAPEEDPTKDEELVAAITTALALQLKTSVSNIVIRNIERIEEPASPWQKAGIAEHMNNYL